MIDSKSDIYIGANINHSMGQIGRTGSFLNATFISPARFPVVGRVPSVALARCERAQSPEAGRN
jgi:hypothetical protein